MAVFPQPTPRTPTTAMLNTMPGNAKNISVSRMIQSSTHPPKYPETIPAVVPIARLIPTMRSDMKSDERIPYKMRENTHRPKSSVPKGNAALGP